VKETCNSFEHGVDGGDGQNSESTSSSALGTSPPPLLIDSCRVESSCACSSNLLAADGSPPTSAIGEAETCSGRLPALHNKSHKMATLEIQSID
jgi:hypothetical protein